MSDEQKPLWPNTLLSPNEKELTALQDKVVPAVSAALSAMQIDVFPQSLLRELYLPLANWVYQHKPAGKPMLLGINGAQGSGKSTLCELLKVILSSGFNLNVAGLSIDDLYLTQAERQELSHTIHPLLATRGVPGTHDVQLGLELVQSLLQAKDDTQTPIPSFDKAIDDRRPSEQWPIFTGKPDVIILEGWCIGCIAQPQDALTDPVNQLEQDEDSTHAWRQYVNDQLQNVYPQLFDQMDQLIMLRVPSMDSVFEWRGLQERKLAALTASAGQQGTAKGIMSEQALKRFIMHYERITRFTLEEMPKRANLTLCLNTAHQVEAILQPSH